MTAYRTYIHRHLVALAMVGLLLGCKQAAPGKTYEDYPEFQEGGEMTLIVDGSPRTIRLNDITFANTEGDYPDYIEALGNDTRLMFECSKSHDLDFDSDAAYQPIVNVPLAIGNLGFDEEGSTLQIPNVDTFDVLNGTITMQKFEIGRDGRDWWEGQISLTLDAADGPLTVSGTFAWCIVPVW